MDHLVRAQNFIERCVWDERFENSQAALEVMIEPLGFGYFACCSHTDLLNPEPAAVMLHNYPRPWANVFVAAELYKKDPVFKYAERARIAFSWNAPDFRAGHTRDQKEILAAASAVGLSGGYTVPIQLSRSLGSQRASFSLVPDGRSNYCDYKLAERIATLAYAALAYRAMPLANHMAMELAPRERQCLELAAQGNTDWESSCILKLSESTVREYIRRAMERIGAATRAQALAYALITGQISLGDVRVPMPDTDRMRGVEPSLAAVQSAAPRG